MPEENLTTTPEIWKPVVGYEGYYEVSNKGRVKRVGHRKHTRIGRIIKPWLSRGYCQVRLSRDGNLIARLAHQLVMEAFVGPRPEKHEVNHINGIKTDNIWPENLEYVTKSQNQLHASDLGLMHRGEDHHKAKLTEEQVKEIIVAEGSHSQIAIKYGISRAMISYIKRGKSWRHIPRP